MIRWIILIVAVLFLKLQWDLWFSEGSIQDIFRLEKVIRGQTQEITKLKTRNFLLETEIEALKKDPKSLEERARAELGMIKEGETFFMVVEPN